MSKHINTHLFFHMNSDTSGGNKNKADTTSTTGSLKPKKTSSSLISGYEIDTNPPIPPESGDYYDYYTNYGIPDFGPTSPPASPLYMYGTEDQYNYDYRNNDYYDYNNYNRSNSNELNDSENYDYRNSNNNGYNNGAYDMAPNSYVPNSHHPTQSTHVDERSINARNSQIAASNHYLRHPAPHINSNAYLQPPLISPPIQDPKRASSSSPFINDFGASSYRHDQQGLSALSHKLHRITFVEACIFQPPDLPSPSIPRAAAPPPPPMPQLPHGPGSQPIRPVLAQGERSPTSTGGTQYYQEWTSKHMRHLCNRFEKPAQQQLLMNVERKSKYPFIILCTPESGSLSKSSSASSTKAIPYQREISQHSAYSLDEEDEEEDEEDSWITQKQRDSINSHYLPPPPPPLLMPHIWPEIRYIDGLYTVCASIVRPGSGIPDDEDTELYLGQEMNHKGYVHENSMYNNHQQQQQQQRHQDKQQQHVTFQKSPAANHHHRNNRHSDQQQQRPAGYIVSAFATFPGEDSERLEKSWLLWTGARILYKYLPMCVGLRRLIFLKRCPDMYRDDMATQNKIKPTIFTGFTYVLLCECYNLKEAYIASVCTTIDQLRARCCGYSALYLTHYQQNQQQSQQAMMEQHSQSQQQPHSQQQHQQPPPHPLQHQVGPSGGHHHPGHTQLPSHHHIPRHHRSTSDFTSEFDTD